MYKKILVPLDGSELSEAALPHAGQLSCDMGSGVVLFMVAPAPKEVIQIGEKGQPGGPTDRPSLFWAPHWAPVVPPAAPLDNIVRYDDDWTVFIDQQEDRIRSRLTAYLNEVGENLTRCGAKVTAVVEFGDPAERIIDYAAANGVDLIVMSTHGRGGMGRFLVGSVAEKVLRGATVPVLLVRCNSCSDKSLPPAI